jgi:type IV pilus assembly protein PilQ
MNGVRLCLMMVPVLAFASLSWGQDVKPAQPAKQDAQAEDPKAKAIRETYEEQLRRDRQEVTLRRRNATVDEIVQDFRGQTGWNIVLDKKNIPEDYRIDEFIVDKERARAALDAFVRKAELSLEEVSQTLLLLSRPPRLTFNFRDADIKVVIDMIARVSGANIIVSPDVKGVITLSINNVPWNEVLDAIVKTLNFTTVKEGFGIIRIIHPDELLKQLETRVFKLKYLQPPSTYAAKVEEGKTISGRPPTPPQSVDEILRTFILKQVLETVLSKNTGGQIVGKLDFDPKSNVFIVRDTKIVLDRIDAIITQLDVEPEQILLDVKFISTTNKDLLQFGVNWSFGGQGGITVRNTVLHPGSFVNPADGAVLDGKVTRLPFGFGEEKSDPGDQLFLSEFDMSMTFRAFKQDVFSRLIQEPTLAVLDGTDATIFVGETISYAEVVSSTNQTGGLQFSVKEAEKSPVKVGFQLFVSPRIVEGTNRVILTVIPQNEFLSGPSTGAAVPGFTRFSLTANGAAQQIDLPRLSQTQLVTKLILESGRTAVLGGLVVERSNYKDEGVPILKDLPLVSYLFKDRQDEINKEHLLIFITPRIIRRGRLPADSLQQLLKMREDQEQREFQENKKNRVGEKK